MTRQIVLVFVLLPLCWTAINADDALVLWLTTRTGGALSVAWTFTPSWLENNTLDSISDLNVSLNGTIIAHVPVLTTTYDFYGLTNNTMYAVAISANVVNSMIVGTSPTSNVLVVSTLNATNPSIPPMPQVVAIGGGFVRVRVLLPFDTGGSNVTNLNIVVRSQTDYSSSSLSHAVTEPEFVVYGLNEKTTYRVQAYVVNNAGLLSGQSTPLFVDTLAAQLPSACPPPTVLRVTGGSFQLQLNPPIDDGGARIRGYIVYLAVNGSSSFQELTNTVGSTEPNIIDIQRLPYPSNQPLRPLTRYDVKAVAVNMVDACINLGNISNISSENVSVVTTVASLPDAPPQPYFLSATGGQVMIQLLTPENMHGSVLLGFAIMVNGAVYGSLATNEEVPYAIGYLYTNTNYSVQVAVNTNIGTSGWSVPLVVSTGPTSRPSSSSTISVSDVTSSQALIQWLSPLDSGGVGIKEYRLSLFSTVGLSTISAPGNTTTYRLNTLLAKTTYRVKISAINEVYLESSSTKTPGITFETLSPTPPTPPSGVRALTSTGGLIEVGWQPPHDTGGSPLLYNVSMFRIASCFSNSSCGACNLVRVPSADEQYTFDQNCAPPSSRSCPDNSSSCCVSTSSSPIGKGQLCSQVGSQDRFRLVLGGSTVTSFDQLNHSTTYFIAVQAINEVGRSNYSSIVGVRTSYQTAPSYPSNIRDIGGTGGSVVLAWDPPRDNGGTTIAGYNVYRDYRLLTPQPVFPPFLDCGNGVLARSQYLYNIAAVNASRIEGSLGAVSVVTRPVSPPLQITSLSLLARTVSWLNFTITASCDLGGSSAASFQFVVRQDGILIASGFFACCNFIVNGLQAAKGYLVGVRVANEVATLEWVNGSFSTSTGIPANTTMIVRRPNSYSLVLAASSGNSSNQEINAYEIAAYRDGDLVQGYTFPCDAIIAPGIHTCPETFRIDGLSPMTSYQISSRALGPNGMSDWNSQIFTTSNESSGMVEFVAQMYAASSGGSVMLSVRRTNGTAGTLTVALDISQPDTVVAQCDCFLGQGCSCGLQLAISGAKRRPGTMSFVDGQDAQMIQVSLWQDNPNVTQSVSVVMSLLSSGGVVGAQSQAVLQVSPSQHGGFPSFTRSQADVFENSSYAKINVVRLNGSSGTISFDIETFDISSVASTHYAPLSQTITMGDRQSSTTVWVRLIDNLFYEGTRVFGIRLRDRTSSSSNGTSRPRSLTTRRIRILDDEDPSMLLPLTPTSLNASRVTGGEIELVWDVPQSTAATRGYLIRASTPSDGTNVFSIYNISSEPPFTLSLLQPGTLYRFQVATWNLYGTSEYSGTLLVLTTGLSSPSAPRNFRANAVGGSYIELIWDTPRDQGGGSITGYQLFIQGEDGSYRLTAKVSQNQTSYKVEGLIALTAYNFSVRASTSEFPGPNAAANITTSTGVPTAPSKPPPPLLMRQPSGGTLTFMINDPNDLGGAPITDYSLYLRRLVVQSDVVQSITNTSFNTTTEEPFQIVCTNATTWASSSSRSCTVYKLLAGTSYEAYVVVYTMIGSSDASDRVVYGTSSTIDLPSSPDNFRASRVTAGNIYLMWDLPMDLGGVTDVIGYTVFQRTSAYYDDSYFVVYDGQDSTERQVAIKGLSRGTVYAFAVIAQNSASYCVNLAAQHMSDFLSVRTLDSSVLSPPQSVMRVGATGGSITIGWQPPDDLAGVPLDGYIVELFMDENGTESQQITPNMLYSGMTQFTHFGLTEQTVYRYAVTGINQDGQGERTLIATFSTAPCSPPQGVTNGTVAGAWGGRLTIAWNAPQDTGGRAIVQYQVTRADHQNRIDTVSSPEFTDTNGLTANTQYLYFIRAFNGLYLGQIGYIWATTGAPTVPNPPLPISTVSYGGRIEVTWTSAEDTGGVPVRGYVVTLMNAERTRALAIFTGLDTSTVFTSLSANTGYALLMAAINQVGEGTNAQYDVSTSEVDLPSAPDAPTAFNITGSSMWLTLHAPSYTGGENVALLLSNGTTILDAFAGEVPAFVQNLVALTTYRFRVIASNSRGQTVGRELVVSTTDVTKPSTVSSIQLLEYSFDRLSISWTPVNDNGGDIGLQYEVSYFVCDASGLPLSSTSAMTSTTSLTAMNLTGLSHTTNYSVAVRPLTSTGIYGDSSPTVIFMTEEPLMGRILVQSSDIFVQEGSPSVYIPLQRVEGSFGNTTYTYEVIDETAIAGANYDALGSEGSMTSGVKTGSIFIALRDDNVYNPNITFIVRVHDGPTSSISETRVTILDDGDAGFISFSAAQYQVLENAGAMYLPLTRTGGNAPTAVIEPYIVTNHAALETRFTLVEQNLTFEEGGATIQDLTVQIEDDSVFQYWPDSVNISFRILQGGVWPGDIIYANLTALDDGDVSPPQQITGLQLVGATGGSVQLMWVPPMDRGGMNVDLWYLVQIFYNGDLVKNATVTSPSIAMYNLTASTAYQTTVSAANGAGVGVPSNRLLFSTTKPTPPTAPLNSVLVAASSSTIIMSWDPPQDSGGSPVIGYTIYNVPNNGTLSPFTSVICSLPTMCSIKGLLALTPYSIQVRANTAAITGGGELSPVSVYQTSNPSVPDAPPQANVTWFSAGAMTIQMFNPINVGGSEVQSYSLYMRGPNSNYFDLKYNGVASSFTVYRLDRRTTYEIKYQAINVVGASDFSPVLSFQTLERSLVSEARDLALVSATGGAITLRWTEPLDLGGRPVTGYTVMIQSLSTNASVVGYDGRGNPATQGVIYGLTANTTYTTYVIAYTEVSSCFSPTNWTKSIPIQASTNLPTLPTPAPTVVLVRVTGGVVELAWNPPLDAGGVPITGYTVALVSPTGTNPIFTGSGTGPFSFVHNDLIESTVYTYLLKASSSVGDSPNSDSLVAKTLIATAPSAPLNVRQLSYVTGGAIQIGWDRPVDTGGQPLQNYWVYRDGAAVAQNLDASVRNFIDKQNLRADTTYAYTVRAVSWSTMGSDQSTSIVAKTAIASKPQMPVIVSNVTGASFLLVNWSSDLDTGGLPISLFDAKLLSGTAAVGSYVGTDTSYRFTRLMSDTTYQFMLTAYNQIGASTPLSVMFKTLSAALPDAPLAPVAVIIFGGNITVEMTSPVDTGGANVTDMRLYEANLGFLGNVSLAPGSLKAQFTMFGLVKATGYAITASAVNRLGEGAQSSPLVVRTGPLSPPGAIRIAPNVTAKTGTTISIVWTAPVDTGGEVSLSYEIRFLPPSGAAVTNVSVSRSSTGTYLNYLTVYNVSVRAINAAGRGDWSPNATAITLPKAAGEFNLEITSVSVLENAGKVVLNVLRSNGLSGVVTVNYALVFPTTNAPTIGKDIVLASGSANAITGSVMFASLQANATISILVLNDDVYEYPDEQFQVRLTSVILTATEPIQVPTLGINTSTTLTILDDGDAGIISFNQSTYAVREDAVNYNITIIREGGKSSRVVLGFTFIDGTAKGDRHYRRQLSSVFPMDDGQTSAVLRIAIINDKIYQFPDEFFTINMTLVSGGAKIKRNSATVIILDDGDISPPATPPPPIRMTSTGGAATFTLGLPLHNGSAGGKLGAYVLRMSNSSSGDALFNLSVPVANTATVGRLLAQTTYNVSVAALASAGLSLFSPATIFSTTVPTLPGPVVTVGLNASTGGSARLVWGQPDDTGGVPITKYRIYKVTQTLPELVAEFLTPDLRGVIYGLTANTSYRFVVQAGNDVLYPDFADGWGALGIPLNVVTPGPSLPGPTRDLRNGTSDPTGGSVSIAWSLPLDTGGTPIREYNVYARSASTGFNLVAVVPQPTSQFSVVERLNSSTVYEMFVLAVSDLKNITLPGYVTCVPGSKVLITSDNLSKRVSNGSVLRVNDNVLVIGNMVNATKGSLPLAIPYAGRAISKQNASAIGVAVTFTNFSTKTPSLPQVPPPPTLVNATGGAITFRMESPGDTGGVPIEKFKVFVDGNEAKEEDVMIQLVATSFLAKTMIMRIANRDPQTTISITAEAVNSMSLCDFSRKSTSLEVQFTTTAISQPDPPQITLQYVTGGGMKFSLVDPFDKGGAAITNYSVYITDNLNKSVWRLASSVKRSADPTKLPTAVVAQLKPQQKYSFRVSARNGMYDSNYSSPVNFSTSGISAPGACEEPYLVASTGGMLTVAWEDPLDNGGASVGEFMLTLQPAQSTSPPSKRFTPSRNYTFYGLSPETDYLVSVKARNAKGYGPDGAVASFSTNATSLPVGVIKVTIVGSTGGAALLMFNEPADLGGTPRDEMVYHVFVDNQDIVILTYSDLVNAFVFSAVAGSGRRLAAGSPSGVVVGGLDPLSLYKIQILPENSVGAGNVSIATSAATTQATLPSAPLELRVKDPPEDSVTGGSVVLSWKPPVDTGGLPLLDYVVYEATSATGLFTETCRDIVTQCRVTALSPTTTYWFYVVVNNTLGASPSSSLVSATTLPISRPSIPGKIKILSVSDQAIGCEWTAPIDDGGSPITGYSITVNDDTNSGQLPSVSSLTTATTILGLSQGTQYSISVVAINQQGSSDPSPARIVTTATAANAPMDPIISCVSKASVSLFWYPHPSGTEYRVLRDGIVVNTDIATNFIDKNVDSNQGYSYKIEANINGNWAGVTSSSVSTTTLDTTSNEGSCTASQGIVSEKQYVANASSSWLVRPTASFTTLTLEFTLFDLECDHDYVQIVNDTDGTFVWQGGCTRVGTFIIQSGDPLHVLFSADSTSQRSGFEMYYEVDRYPVTEVPTRIPPPQSASGLSCYGHGSRQNNGTCRCSVGFTGEGCNNLIVCCTDPTSCSHNVCSLDSSRVIVVSTEFGDDAVGTGAMMNTSKHGTASKAVKTLSKGLSLANDGDTIFVYPGVYKGSLNRDLQIASKQNITIETLKGYAWTSIDCENAGRAMQLMGSSVTLDGLTIRNGFTANEGGSIKLTDSSLEIRNVLITNSIASSNGGAIAAKQSTISITGVGVEKSTASNGGGVSLIDSGFWMTQSNITTCKADNGGAASLTGLSTIEGDISSTISNNVATGDGGGVLVGNGNAILKNLMISNNTAARGGGFAAWDSSSVTVDAFRVNNNNATLNGGGIALVGSVVLHGNETTVRDNVATASGGGLFIQGQDVTLLFDGIASSVLILNQAVSGAGIAVVDTHLRLTGVAILNSSASGTGGGVAVANSIIELSNVTVLGNTASTMGGGVHAVSSQIEAGESVVVDSNQATINGGGLYLRDSSASGTLLVSQNKATQAGGGFYGEGVVSLQAMVIQSCTADQGGGGFLNGAAGTIQHVHVIDCTAISSGGGWALASSTLHVLSSEIHGCSSVNGGGIHAHGLSGINGDLVIRASSGSNKGGALYATDKIQLSDIVIQASKATHGGGIYVELAEVIGTNLTLLSCVSLYEGGGWSADSSTLTLQDVHLTSHQSGSFGGGLALLKTDVFHDNVEISNNIAITNGAGISVINSTFTPSPANPTATSFITDNAAHEWGGNLYVEGTGVLEATKVMNGKVDKFGGGIAAKQATFTIHNSAIDHNSARQHGGGLYLSESSICTIINSSLANNWASVTGGGVCVNNSVVNHASVVFQRNTASRGGAFSIEGTSKALPLATGVTSLINASRASGGLSIGTGDGSAMYLAPESDVEVVGFQISSGEADRGSVYVDNATLQIDDCEFTNNSAAEGAAIYASISTVGITNCQFVNNHANTSGGVAVFSGIDAGRTSAEMTDCVLTSNDAGHVGGAITLSFADLVMTNLHLETNAIHADDGGGGAIAAITTSTLNATNCTFINNAVLSSKAIGATLYLLKATTTRLQTASIQSDWNLQPVSHQGGAVYVSDQDSLLSLIDCDVGYSRSYAGGAIYALHASLDLLRTTLHHGHAEEFGGSLFVDNGVVNMTNCTFSDNYALYDGGAVYVKGPSRVTMDATVIRNNTVQDGGAGLYVAPGSGASVNVTQSKFTTNINRGLGSAIFVGRKNRLNLAFVNIVNNGGSATEGGTLYAVDSQVNVDNSNFTGNSAILGGAIQLTRDATLTMTMSNVTANQATIWGGAVYMSVRAIANIQDTTFQNNTATTGGALYLLGSSKLTVGSSIFTDNRALSFGGAMTLVGRASADITTCSFVMNAAYTGGMVSVTQNASLAVTSTKLSNNMARDFGGGIYVDTLTRTQDHAIRLQALEAHDNNASAGNDIYWVYHAWCTIGCDDCGKLQIATSPVFITAGYWPKNVTSGVSLGITKQQWKDPSPQVNASFPGSGSSGGFPATPGRRERRLDSSSSSSSSSENDAFMFNAIAANPNQSSPYANSIWPTIVVRDYYNAITDQDNRTHCFAMKLENETDKFDFYPPNILDIAHGYITFEDAQILADSRDSPFVLFINCSLADDVERTLTITIKVNECNPGYESVDGRCIPCKKGTYSLDGVACHTCPIGATCDGLDETKTPIGVSIPSREEGYFLHDSRNSYLNDYCDNPSSWDNNDPCKNVTVKPDNPGTLTMTRRLQNCSKDGNFTKFWSSRRIFACLANLEYYECDTRAACFQESAYEVRHAKSVDELTQRVQCDSGYGSVTCATCQPTFYKVASGACYPCSNSTDPTVAKMTRIMASIPIGFGVIALVLVWWYFSNSTESEIMKQARAARKFQIYDPHARPQSLLLATSFLVKQQVTAMMTRARQTLVWRRNRPRLFQIEHQRVQNPPLRAEKFKIMLGFFQIFGGFKKLYEIPWPVEMSHLMDIFSIADFSLVDTTGIECFIPKNYFSNYRVSILVIFVLLFMVTLLLSWGVVRYRVKLTGLPRHCVKCGLPVFQMLRREPKTVLRCATMVSMLRIEQKERELRMRRRSIATRAKDTIMNKIDDWIIRAKHWWNHTRAGRLFERFMIFVRLPASSSKHHPSCPTTQRITSEVLAMVVRSNLRLWRSRVRLRLNYQSFQNKCIKLFFWILLLFYPELSQRVIGIFYCDEIGSKHYMSRDKSRLCYEGEWLYYLPLTFFLIVVWVIGVPLLFWTLIFLKRRSGVEDKILLLEDPSHFQLKQRLLKEMHEDLMDRGIFLEPEKLKNFEKDLMVEFLRNKRLNEPSMIAQVGFIYHSYRTEFWWFEVWDLGRKLFLNCVVGLLAKTGANRIIAGLIVFLIYLSVMLFYQPYKEQSDSTLAGVTQIQLFITLFCGLLLKMGILHMADTVIMLLTYAAFVSNVLTMSFAVFSIVYEKIDGIRKARRRAREEYRRAIQTHVHKLWLKGYGWALTEVYLRDNSIRPMPFRVILELTRRDREERRLMEMDLQLAQTLHPDDQVGEAEDVSASQVELELPRPGIVDTPSRSSSRRQEEDPTPEMPHQQRHVTFNEPHSSLDLKATKQDEAPNLNVPASAELGDEAIEHENQVRTSSRDHK